MTVGKSALVTGGAQGMGEAFARRLAKDGYHVSIIDVLDAQGERVAAEIQGTFYHVDISNPKEVEHVIARIVESQGRLDAVVNNAAIVGPQLPLHEYPLEDWKRVMGINMDGLFYVLKFSLAQMVKQRDGGSIVNMSSTTGFRGVANNGPYTASKWAVRGLTHMAAVEYGQANIRVNAIAPATVETPMLKQYIAESKNPIKMKEIIKSPNAVPGLAQPEDVAHTVAFLLSDKARFITGHTLPVDSGALSRIANSPERQVVKSAL